MSKAKIIEGALQPGTVIRSSVDGFRVDAVLGAGGFGITYRVTRLSDGRVLAMKEYFPDKLCERGEGDTLSYLKTNAQSIETGLKDFITEAERLNRQNISHPNIVAVDSVFRANNTAYYTMEFVDGSDLMQYVTKRNGGRPLSVAQTLSVMRPVLQAVSVLHASRLTHLDLKHENILLTFESDGSLRPVIIDFGQSKHYDKKGRATSQLTNAGCSDGFAPPEQYQGLVTFTPQADVYALSATILYLLTARQPVNSADISAAKITEALSPQNVPDRIVDALIRGMRRDKADRTQSVEALASDLGIEITTRSPEGNVTRLLNLDRPKRFSRISRRGWTAIVLSLVFICLLVGGFVKYAGRGIQQTPIPIADDSVSSIEAQLTQDSLPRQTVAASAESQPVPEQREIETELSDNGPQNHEKTSENVLNSVDQSVESTEGNKNVDSDTQKSQQERLNEALKDPTFGAGHISILAELENYAPAYFHHAKKLISSGNTLKAKKYLQKSIDANCNAAQSKELLEMLNE